MRVSAGLGVATGLLAAVTSCSAPTVHPTGAPATRSVVIPAAQSVGPNPAVGAVFVGGDTLHTCSAAVLDSPAGDLILTAAHCLADGVDATFVAGFNDEAPDEDFWHIDAVYLDPRWVQSQDPRADFAIARVSRASGGSVKDSTGGGLSLGAAPKPGAVVTVTGYGMGVGGGPISCTAPIADETKGFPSLACGGLVDGVSGAPWINGATITGVVGGLDGGGCDEDVSYSPPFDDAIAAVLARAEAGGPADTAPTALGDDC